MPGRGFRRRRRRYRRFGNRRRRARYRRRRPRLRPELKKDLTSYTFNPLAGGTVDRLTDIVQGTAVSERIGNKIVLKNFTVRMQYNNINNATPNTTASTRFRMVIFQSKQFSNTTPNVTDILDSADILSTWNRNTRPLFHILYDKVFSMNQLVAMGAAGGGVQIPQELRRFWKKTFNYNKICWYDGAGATDLYHNHPYIMLIPDLVDSVRIDIEVAVNFYDN